MTELESDLNDRPSERPARRRIDDGAADLETQVDLGWQEPPPEPPVQTEDPSNDGT
ncbi:hypothetical protein ACPB9J_33480 [Streptomyces lavendulocolor]|jgi:hypothetical protein|uniref:hypothetical protein n=1 Tax=Streptomyces lavendulocolor TaxID=67316 RepID=UPI003C2DF390